MPHRAGPKGGNANVRADLIEAACALYAEKGLDPVSLREIAERAGVNQAMIRHYFTDKFGFEKALLDLGGQAILAEVPEDEDFETTFRAAVSSLQKMPWFTVLRVRNIYLSDTHREYINTQYFSVLMGRFARALGKPSELDLLCVASMLEMPDVARNVTTDGFDVKFSKNFAKSYASHVAKLMSR